VVGMRTGRLRVAALAGAVLALTGCVGGTPLPTLPPTPTTTPIFASEEEALAAAEEAYAAYSRISDLISAEGGRDAQRIAPYVTEEVLASELEAAAFLESRGWRAIGHPTVTKFDLQQYSETRTQAEITVYVCLDVSTVAIVNADGKDVTPANRDSKVALEVGFTGNARDALLISSSEQWPDSSIC